ncbi:hypothetical protein AVEN_88035-1 [Araneus ventricosus]|uniref:Uncharacterized protein n=1 Tax=Araneus ventricosus TaxID=182803 RepID=A0A4Y2L3S1_ARAVE|nr:hypothetical protein AVEN_88035-1 [Araneus ventricosus]
MTEGMLVDWDRLGARMSLEFYPLCELVSCYLTPSGRCVDPLGTTLEFRLQCELGSWNLRSDNHSNAILVDTVEMALEIDTDKNFESIHRHRVRRRKRQFDCENQEEPIIDAQEKYKFELFYHPVDTAINSLEQRFSQLQHYNSYFRFYIIYMN